MDIVVPAIKRAGGRVSKKIDYGLFDKYQHVDGVLALAPTRFTWRLATAGRLALLLGHILLIQPSSPTFTLLDYYNKF